MIQLKPETERLLEEEVRKGRFESVDEIIGEALRALREHQAKETTAEQRRRAVEWAIDFAKNRPIPLGHTSIKELIHEGHRL